MIRNVVFELILIICYIYNCEAKSSLYQYHFRCATGQYINDNWFCNGNSECNGDLTRSDEAYGCDRALCGEGKFKCTDGTCMNVTVLCNTINDCTDGSDEKYCGDEIDTEICPSREGSFLCLDELKCIDLKNVCDEYCNCLDCSDEKEGCLQYDNYLCDKCSDTCYVTSNDTNSQFKTSPSQNISLTPCKACQYSFGNCEQKCLYIEKSKERCICDENYEAIGFNSYGHENCVNKVSYENVIVYSTPNRVKLFNLTTNETITLQSDIDCTALAAAHDYVYSAQYYADLGRGVIFKTSITSHQEEDNPIIQTESKILSIAIDWITNNIYYTTNSSIMVCSEDGNTCAKLKSCSECRVKLSPKLGLMLWNENKQLFQSHMDGSNEQNFTMSKGRRYWYSSYQYTYKNNTDFFFDVDESTDLVFFSNYLPSVTKHRLYSEDYEREFNMYGAYESKFFDFDEFEKGIFLSAEGKNSIYRYAEKENFLAYVRFTDNSTTTIKYIHAYNRLLQRTKIPNPCKNAACSLCLLRPFTPFIGLNYECKCDEIHSKTNQFSCDDESHVRSASIPDATARKRDIYDVNNPPFTWGRFLSKNKAIIVMIVMIVLIVGVIYGNRKYDWWEKLRTMLVNFK